MKKTLAFLLAAFLCSTAFTACNDTPANDTAKISETETEASESESIATEETALSDGLPDELDFDGESLRFLYYGGGVENEMSFCGNENGDVLGETIYLRNMQTEERFNMKLDFISIAAEANGTDNSYKIFKSSVLSGDDEYDVYFSLADLLVDAGNSGYLQSISDYPYIDLSKPWWSKDFTENVSVNTKFANLLFGDINYQTINHISCMFFNKNLFESYTGVASEDFYTEIFDGGWTIDALKEYAGMCYTDINGNGEMDDEDIYGLAEKKNNTGGIQFLVYGAGLKFAGRDSDNMPYPDINNENTVSLIEKLTALFSEDCYIIKTQDVESHIFFKNDHSVFYIDRLAQAEWTFRDMESDFGVIPCPKFDEAMDKYHSSTCQYSMTGGIPITTNGKNDLIGATMEALGAYSYNYVTPVYLEVALGTKYIRDSLSADVIDLIIGGVTTDFYYMNVTTVRDMFNNCILNKKEFASEYAKKESLIINNTQKLIDVYNERIGG